MAIVQQIVLALSLLLFVQAMYSVYLMLYSWEHPYRLRSSNVSGPFLPPQLSFSVLLPARHEEDVIYETIRSVWSSHYPSQLLEIIVICHADDVATIAEVHRAIREINSSNIRLSTFADFPINKPHGLNVGYAQSRNQVITIFDSEDNVEPHLFQMINTIMLTERVKVVQAGVQLMNFRDRWFGIHNCLEYYFWFKSRLHYHSKVGLIPLGGNTVFMKREVLERIGGWDQYCLTEDADMGIRLSTLQEPIRVVYNPQLVTREEIPVSTSAFVKQRSRWSQGFLQVLKKGTWRNVPTLFQKLLALYTLAGPIWQGILLILVPINIISTLFLKTTVSIAMLAFLPLYALIVQLVISLVGFWSFTQEYQSSVSVIDFMWAIITFLPFQWMVGFGALRGVFREFTGNNSWEKTKHIGAHRRDDVDIFVQEVTSRSAQTV